MNIQRLRLVQSTRRTRTNVTIASHCRLLTIQTSDQRSRRQQILEDIARFQVQKKDRYEDTTWFLAKPEHKPASTEHTSPQDVHRVVSFLKKEIAPALWRSGEKLDEQSFLCLVPAIPDIATLRLIERLFDVPASPTVKHEFFNKKSKVLNVFKLRQLYGDARKGGLIIDWSVVDPLIRRICEDFNTVTSSDIEAAIRMYKTAQRAEDSQRYQSKQNKTLLKHCFSSAACHLAMRLATESKDPGHIAFANDIIQSLHRVKSKPSGAFTGASAAVAIRMATSCDEAITAYRTVRSQMNCKLQSVTYRSILWTYTHTVPSHWNNFASVFHGYFTILKDLEKDGIEAMSEHFIPLYDALLKASIAIMNDQDVEKRNRMRRMLIDVLERVRNRTNTDHPNVSHRVLLCQLMQVYGRLFHFSGVLEVWKAICKIRLPDNSTLSVFLDACGFAGEADLVIATKKELEEKGYRLNGNKWLSFLECLCRSGRLGEAIHQFTQHSPRGPDGKPDRVAMLLLLGQAYKSRRLLPTRNLLKKYFPVSMSAHEGDTPHELFLLTTPSERSGTKQGTSTS